jgi:hypothetical protein
MGVDGGVEGDGVEGRGGGGEGGPLGVVGRRWDGVGGTHTAKGLVLGQVPHVDADHIEGGSWNNLFRVGWERDLVPQGVVRRGLHY